MVQLHHVRISEQLVGKVQEITNVNILNYNGNDNTNKETVDDDNTVYCDCRERNMLNLFKVIAAWIVFYCISL